MKGIVRDIIEAKKKEVAERRREKPLGELRKEAKPAERSFKQALESKRHSINLIAEIKKASPSVGVLREGFNVKEIASAYGRHAQAISVITDEKFFQGSTAFLKEAKASCPLPILRKDFVVDEYQVYESAVLGADAILLIASIVSKDKLQKFVEVAKDIGIAALVEVHSSEDFERAFSHDVEIIGVNNRDLETMQVDLKTFDRVRPLIPSDRIVVAESGYQSKEQISSLKGKADAVLVGSVLMRAVSIEEKLAELGF